MEIQEKIKLVIWDLDDTFWTGTLSEEGVSFPREGTYVVKELSNRGIVNSISSKNEFELAKEKLQEFDVWEYFVFPKIGWHSKSQAIKDTIDQMALRPCNVLFIDDNHMNLAEVKGLIPTINIAGPEFISDILSHTSFEGKPDLKLSRLKQYSILEDKFEDSKSYSNNEDFLNSSGIKVSINKFNISELERVHELLERSNQLNFTKNRASKYELSEILHNSDSYTVCVQDNYGDYGLVGFVSFKLGNIEHFTFSCRIMNLGIERFVFHYFDCPNFDVVGSVVGELDGPKPSWIELIALENVTQGVDLSRKKILFKGGCDLSQMLHYLDKKMFDITEETNFVNEHNFPVHAEHSNILLQIIRGIENNKYFSFYPSSIYNTSFFSNDYDVIIYSPLMDYTQAIYKSNKTGDVICFGGYTDKFNSTNLLYKEYKKLGRNISKSEIDEFASEFEYQGQISPEKFGMNLRAILNAIPNRTQVIIMNGAEVDASNVQEPGSNIRHKCMNIELEKVVDEFNNVTLLDVRHVVTSSDDITDNIRHYRRVKYFELSNKLSDILNISKNTIWRYLSISMIKFANKVKLKIMAM